MKEMSHERRKRAHVAADTWFQDFVNTVGNNNLPQRLQPIPDVDALRVSCLPTTLVRRMRPALITLLFLISSCVQAQKLAGPSRRHTVPPGPPDTVSEALFADSLVLVVPGSGGGRISLNIVLVDFQPTASQAQTQTAIASIRGEVVGGIRNPLFNDGTYVVRIQHDGTLEPVKRAMEKLQTLPQVLSVSLWVAAPGRVSA
jgi:hypothetical protein